MLTLDLSKTIGQVPEEELKNMEPFAKIALDQVLNRQGAGSEFLGWVDLPENYDQEEFQRILAAAERIKANSDALVVIGIGGSYLGAKAAIDLLTHSYHNQMPKDRRGGTEIYYLGNQMSSQALVDFLDFIGDRDISVNVITKSGTTTEPALAFRVMKAYLEDRYGAEEAAQRIFATTDANKGALKSLATTTGYETFVVPDDIGGRYSVLTAVGLLPMACAGIDIQEVMAGAQAARKKYTEEAYKTNDCLKYSVARNLLERRGKTVEVLVNYEPKLQYFAEWWKQLYGESEGKGGKGIFPASVNFSTDLHSMGQYIQDGRRMLFETVLHLENAAKDFTIPIDEGDLDGLNFLAGKSLHQVNEKAFQGTVLAHNDGGVPNLILHLKDLSPASFGHLVYFFELACAVSGYILGVNPFDQPGVEAYKKNMFALLGKPGYEDLAKELTESLN